MIRSTQPHVAGESANYIAINRNKRSIAIDLKKPEGREIVLKLAAASDCVLENFRPGVMERLGLGYEALKKAKPDIIYCAISGFGQDGPLKFNPAYDQIIQGLSGVMAINGDERLNPLRCGFPVCDTEIGRAHV